MRQRFARWAANTLIRGAYAVVPITPVLASLVFWRKRFVLDYVGTMVRARRHIAAMQKGPALHYFQDVAGRVREVPEHIEGECIQCGNCCMNHECMFLESAGPQKFQCGIYHSPLRKLSNCGSFPLHGEDIERYSCPSYFVVPNAKAVIPIYPASC